MKLVSKSDFAREMNISPQRVHSLIKKGMIYVRKDGKINLDKAKKILEDNRSLLPQKDTKYIDARAQHEIIKLKIAELELKQKKGELIEKEKVIKYCQDIISISKSKILSIPVKVAPLIVGMTSIKKIKIILEKEIHQALNELARLKNVA